MKIPHLPTRKQYFRVVVSLFLTNFLVLTTVFVILLTPLLPLFSVGKRVYNINTTVISPLAEGEA
ncbi:MAG: hypothetical protein OD816_000298 [Thermodesulfobacterium sp.]|uniref:Uncharacterized protein n=1 Tax=Candidatus Thermodesulfobacterium syntrophicum TaxID=3060442 RepID=A0AAE3TFJ2_9BACT|nr:hypothetical protein [Candidatus Thermodesulfobacterium syntrophicum]